MKRPHCFPINLHECTFLILQMVVGVGCYSSSNCWLIDSIGKFTFLVIKFSNKRYACNFLIFACLPGFHAYQYQFFQFQDMKNEVKASSSNLWLPQTSRTFFFVHACLSLVLCRSSFILTHYLTSERIFYSFLSWFKDD